MSSGVAHSPPEACAPIKAGRLKRVMGVQAEYRSARDFYDFLQLPDGCEGPGEAGAKKLFVLGLLHCLNRLESGENGQNLRCPQTPHAFLLDDHNITFMHLLMADP